MPLVSYRGAYHNIGFVSLCVRFLASRSIYLNFHWNRTPALISLSWIPLSPTTFW